MKDFSRTASECLKEYPKYEDGLTFSNTMC